MGCLDEATLDDLVSGRLSGDTLRSAEEHLDSCRSCSEVVSVLAGGAPHLEGELELEAGTRVGRYVVRAAAGRGAMGIVYVADDPELARRVALKLIRPGAGTEPAERMLQEAQALARLSHPNVVAIHDVGQTNGGVYFAMELVEGANLRDWLRGRPPLNAAVSVLIQAGRGLYAAHRAGIVHRDFKPENVMVGNDGRARVTDFGLARVADSVDVVKGLAGTPAYMAPELFTGTAAGELSDQYAFGVVLREAVSPDRCPSWLRKIVLRATDKTPAGRYPNLGTLLDELSRGGKRPRWLATAVIAGVVLVVGAISIANRTSDPCAGAESKVASVWAREQHAPLREAFLRAGGAIGPSSADRVISALDALAAKLGAERRAACEATHVQKEQSEAVLDARMRCLDRQLDGIRALGRSFATADAAVVRGAVQAVSELPQPSECAEVESIAAMDPRPSHAEHERELEALERELSETQAVASSGRSGDWPVHAKALATRATQLGYRPAIADAELLTATLARRSADYEEAKKRARLALTTAEASRADRIAARAWLEILAIDGERGEPARVADNAGLASGALARIGDPPELRAALSLLSGMAHTLTGDLDAARIELERSLSLQTKLHGDKSLFVSRTLSAQGTLARARGQYPEALALHERALRLDSELLGAAHPACAVHHHNVAGILRLSRRHTDALARYEKALAIESHALGAQHPRVALTENSIAILRLETSDIAKARASLMRALAILEKSQHPDRALVLSNLGIADAAENQHASALGRFDQALEIVKRTLGPNHLRLAGILRERARSFAAQGQRANRERDLVEARRVALLHENQSLEAASLAKQLAVELAERPKAKPARVPSAPQLGSSTYGAATRWDPD
jgi:tetratricopeptide (TPR) repeat protein